jgi:hypothetical protein
MTGAATGTRIDDIEICAAGTTTAGAVRLWLYDGSSSIGEIGRTTNPQSLTVAVGMQIGRAHV